MTTTKSSPHLLVIPFPAQGHLLPLLDVARHLSAISPDLAITILITPKNLPLLSPILSACPTIQPLVLPFPSLPNFSAEHVRDIPPSSSVGSLFYALSLLQPHIISWATSIGNRPTAIISDFFLGWTDSLAKQLGVPRFNFASVSALLISVLDRLFRYGTDESLRPLLPSDFPYDHLPSVFRRYRANAGLPEWELVRDSMIANANSHAHVINTFHSLEGGYLDHLRRSYGHGRVWAVGPAALRVMDVPLLPQEVATWLYRCPPKSVVYVCFGSQFSLGGDHARALAGALEASGARFLWAAGTSEVSDLFEERTLVDRGMVLRGWAPQKAVLAHGAVGSFLTHCGWNSVLEGVVAGVMLLAWPMEADQFVNARLLVDDKKAAVRACVGGPNVVPGVAALAKIFADSVDGGKFIEVKTKAEEMKRMALEAVEEGGSSYYEMEKFVREVTQLNVKEY